MKKKLICVALLAIFAVGILSLTNVKLMGGPDPEPWGGAPVNSIVENV